MKYSGTGNLTVRAYTAGGALPVEGSVVRITGVDEWNRFVEYSLLTDIDGLTKIISLPTPELSFSQAPNPSEIPYGVYDVEISKDGFYTKKIKNVAIFAGVDSMQPINMIPVSISDDGAFYPRGNLDATVYENELLEA